MLQLWQVVLVIAMLSDSGKTLLRDGRGRGLSISAQNDVNNLKLRRSEFEELHKIVASEIHTLVINYAHDPISAFFNEKLMSSESSINETIQQHLVPLYGKKMWIREQPPIDWYNKVEDFVMCPKNSYVRGIHDGSRSSTLGTSAQVLCSQYEPYSEPHQTYIKGALSHCIFPMKSEERGTHCLIEATAEYYYYCSAGEYYTFNRFANGQTCWTNPCGPGAGVCGLANPRMSGNGKGWQTVCCEVGDVPKPFIPCIKNQDGTDNPAALIYVLNKLRNWYSAANGGQSGTDIQVVNYFREKYKFSRLLHVERQNESSVSAAVTSLLAAGRSMNESLQAASAINGIPYWVINEKHAVPTTDLITILCPKGSYLHGRTAFTILCSERSPIIGPVETKILGGSGVCRDKNYMGRSLFTCKMPTKTGWDSLVWMCRRGFYGRNGREEDPRCHINLCGQGNKVCGLFFPYNPQNKLIDKVICCRG